MSFRVSPDALKKTAKKCAGGRGTARSSLASAEARTAVANTPTILVVEPKPESRALLQDAAGRYGHVESFPSFESARVRLAAGSFDCLVTNLRLAAFNGLHLVYLSRLHGSGARTLVYSDVLDPSLAREAHAAGAAYSDLERIQQLLAANLDPQPAMSRASISADASRKTGATRRKASTTAGSKWVPFPSTMRSRASVGGRGPR